VEGAAASCAHGAPCRVRVTLALGGAFSAACAPLPGGLPPLPAGGALAGPPPPRTAAAPAAVVALAVAPTPRRHPLLRHKTTDRRLYEWHRDAAAAAAAAAAAPPPFDVLLFNEDGHATEFTIGNLVVRAAPGAPLVTPPVDHGLLPGVLRAQLLAAGVLTVGAVTVEEAAGAEELWLVNAVRGWVPVRLQCNARGNM